MQNRWCVVAEGCCKGLGALLQEIWGVAAWNVESCCKECGVLWQGVVARDS